MNRVIIWFSCGAASAMSAYFTLKEYPNAELVYCDTGSEHEDNKRFLRDVEDWLGAKVTVLRSDKYSDHLDVIRKTKYINGVRGARCTVELKKVLRFKFQRADDLQIFGYTCEEKNRAKRFNESFPEVSAAFPLIERNFTKEMCLGYLDNIGIKIPAMYSLGFNNNNCIGCVKGGMGYWNHIRKVFPDRFTEMAKIERELGRSCIREKFLDELLEDAGNHKEPIISCDFVCQSEVLKA